MSSTFLTRAEVAELTGRHRKAGQVEWLKRHGIGIRWWPNAAGWPVIPRSAIDGTTEATNPTPAPWQPDVLRAA